MARFCWKNPVILAAIDGIGKEDLFYAGDENDRPNPQREIETGIRLLKHAAAAGKLVLTVEYLTNREHIQDYRARAAEAEFIGLRRSSFPGPSGSAIEILTAKL